MGDEGGCEVLGVSWTRDTLLFTLTTRLAMVVDQEQPRPPAQDWLALVVQPSRTMT
jgi:hypothetical protein